MKKGSIDLTQGNIPIQVLQVALPILMGQIFQNLYNSVDSLVVGNFVGTTALAAGTSGGDISNLLIGFFTGLSVGSSVLFSQCFGAKNYEKLHRAIHTALLFAAIIGLVMAALGVAFTPLLLRLVKCPDDVWPEASLYLRIYLIGIFFTSVYNVASGVLRALGDTKRPLYYLIVASCCNIFLDVVLVAVVPLGVAGVAIATVISQLASCILIFRKMLTTEDYYRLTPKDLRLDGEILSDVVRLGLPTAVQGCLVSFSNLIVQRYVNAFGSTAMAGIGAAKKIDKYVSEFSQAVGHTTPVFVGQNVGAGNYDRAGKSVRWTLGVGIACVIAVGIPVYFAAPGMVRLFIKDEEAIAYGVQMLRVLIPAYFLLVFHQVFSNAVRGYGYSTAAMIISMIGLIGARQTFLYLSMQSSYDPINVFASYPVGWGATAVMLVTFYFVVVKRKVRKLKAAAQGTK